MPIDFEKIRTLREEKGLSQAEAAMKAGLSTSEANARQRWNAIESGRKGNITIETLDAIAKALGCKAKDLLK